MFTDSGFRLKPGPAWTSSRSCLVGVFPTRGFLLRDQSEFPRIFGFCGFSMLKSIPGLLLSLWLFSPDAVRVVVRARIVFFSELMDGCLQQIIGLRVVRGPDWAWSNQVRYNFGTFFHGLLWGIPKQPKYQTAENEKLVSNSRIFLYVAI